MVGEKEPDQLDKPGHSQEVSGPVNILAIIQAFENRPDLLLERLEEYDPGIIKRLNEAALKHLAVDQQRRSRFVQINAYSVLFFRMAGAMAAFASCIFFAWDARGISLIILFFLATIVFLGGEKAFLTICEAVVSWVKKTFR